MGLTIGTNCGFVTTAPSSDPATGDELNFDEMGHTTQDTSPAGDNKITEIGIWIGEATSAADLNLGIYDDTAGAPDSLLFNTTFAKGTTSGWKSTAVNWAISASTVYHIAGQLDNTTTLTTTDRDAAGGTYRGYLGPVRTQLPATYDGTAYTGFVALYVKWEAAGADYTKVQVNIADAWKSASNVQINIGDVWKTVTKMEINIGDTWKTVFS